MKRSRATAQRGNTATAVCVRDMVAEAELAKQRARLYSRARVFIAAKYLGNSDSTIEFDAIATVLNELLLAANAANQRAQTLLATLVKPDPGRPRGRPPTGVSRKGS